MTTVETTVTITIPEKGMTLEDLESEIGQALKNAGQHLVAQVCQAMEAEILEQEGSKYLRDKRRTLDLLKRFGWIRLYRCQMREKGGGYCRPLDKLPGLELRQHASPWVIGQSVALATRLPYRQAAYLLATFVEEPIDHRNLYLWVQKASAQIVAKEDELQTDVFKHGVISPRDPQEREIILVEVDGTFLRAQREEGTQFEVRLGVLTTGKALESPTAKPCPERSRRDRRYRLLERVRYGGTEPAQDFG